jgi:8-oxo-dGTP pyrophosphatase MutT (NUDIX family)
LTRIQENVSKYPNRILEISPHIPMDLIGKNSAAAQPKKVASVLIPLCNRNNEASIIFTLRSDIVGTHKGQVSFPGGHINPGENAVEAAIRESYEELGLNIGDIEILGVCQTIPAITGTLVTPVIGFLRNDVGNFEHFTPSEDEVKLVFSHTLTTLQSPGFRDEQWLDRNGQRIKFPVFDPQSSNTTIWGLTAFILDAVLKNAIYPSLLESAETSSSSEDTPAPSSS